MAVMTKEDEILVAQALDRARRAEYKSILSHSGFLDVRQQTLLERELTAAGARFVFWGGYGDAERQAAFFLPDRFFSGKGAYEALRAEGAAAAMLPLELKEELKVLRVSLSKGAKGLTHRDYLGALLGLGVDRSVSGDILLHTGEEAGCSEQGADLIVLSPMADFLAENYVQVGREHTSNRILPIDDLIIKPPVLEEHSDTVASLRLDNIISSVFRLSRAKAAEAVRGGLVYVDNRLCEKPDRQVEEGSKLTLRGKGKAVLIDCGGRSRKDRVYIRYGIYK